MAHAKLPGGEQGSENLAHSETECRMSVHGGESTSEREAKVQGAKKGPSSEADNGANAN